NSRRRLRTGRLPSRGNPSAEAALRRTSRFPFPTPDRASPRLLLAERAAASPRARNPESAAPEFRRGPDGPDAHATTHARRLPVDDPDSPPADALHGSRRDGRVLRDAGGDHHRTDPEPALLHRAPVRTG